MYPRTSQNHWFSCSCHMQVFIHWPSWSNVKMNDFLACLLFLQTKKKLLLLIPIQINGSLGKKKQTNKQGNALYLGLSFHSWQMGLVFFTATFWKQYVVLSFLCKRVTALNLYHIDHFTSFHLGSKLIHSIVIALLFFIWILLIYCQ